VIEGEIDDNEDNKLDLPCGWWFVWLTKAQAFECFYCYRQAYVMVYIAYGCVSL